MLWCPASSAKTRTEIPFVANSVINDRLPLCEEGDDPDFEKVISMLKSHGAKWWIMTQKINETPLNLMGRFL